MSKIRLVILGSLALGLALPMNAQPQDGLQPADRQAKAMDPALAGVPTDSFMFVSVKASKLWDNPAAKPIRDWVMIQKTGPLDTVIGLPLSNVDRVTLFIPTAQGERVAPPLMLVGTRAPYNEARVLKALGVGQSGQDRRMIGRVAEVDGQFSHVAFLDDQTLLFLRDEGSNELSRANLLAQLIARKRDGPLAAALTSASDHDLTVGLDVAGLANTLRLDRAGSAKEFAPFLMLLKAKTATLTADFGMSANGKLVLSFPDNTTAKRAVPVMEEGIKTIASLLVGERADRPANADPIENAAVSWSLTILNSAKVTAEGTNVVVQADVPYQEELAKFVATLPKSIGIARNDTKAMNNLKQLGLAMHNYYDAMGAFPGDVWVGAKAPAWSWRVQLLPYVEQAQIYNKLDLTQPWDSPGNVKVLESVEMPKLFEIPGRPAPKGHTYFRIFSLPRDAKGTEVPFFREGEHGPRITSITDGTSNTFMIVEAGEAVPWYKPDLLAYDGKLPLPPLGDRAADRLLVVLGDGSVKSLRPSKLDEKTIRALITINGGEVVQLPR